MKLLKKYKFIISSGFLVLLLITTGLYWIRSNNQSETAETPPHTKAEALMNSQTLYVGNHNKVIKLLGLLSYGAQRGDVALQTKNTPYGVTVNYDLSKIRDSAGEIEFNLQNNATLMFALINNLDNVNFQVAGTAKQNYQFQRSEVQKNYNKDLREYPRNLPDLTAFYNNLNLRIYAFPEKYSPAMSSTPGIRLTAKYHEKVVSVRYTTTTGTLLTWNSKTGKIKKHGRTVELPADLPVYWSPTAAKKKDRASDFNAVGVYILDANNNILAQKEVLLSGSRNQLYTVQTKTDIMVGRLGN